MGFDRKAWAKKEYDRKYYLKNKMRIKKNVKKWAEKNPDKLKMYSKKANNSEIAKIRKIKWIEDNPEKNRTTKNEWKKKYRKQNPKIVNARNMASKKIPLKENCEICKSKKNLQRHHWRYDKPLMVNTLCSTCHKIQHIKHFDKSIYRGGGEY